LTEYIEVLNPEVKSKVGHIKHALIDFDGTISVIRQGWEEVMIPMMVEMICNGSPSTQNIEDEIQEYVDYSTGTLTIVQMQWLAEAVHRYGLAKKPKTPYEYKRIYNERLLLRVEQRLRRLNNGELNPDDLMIMGSRDFLERLLSRGVLMYLASGTDHEYVLREASALRIVEHFEGGVYGALDHTEANDKERIIHRILDENKLQGKELLVVGDGPVEIRSARARDAIALGVATDEVNRRGLNQRKRMRLLKARADLIVPDFTRNDELFSFLF